MWVRGFALVRNADPKASVRDNEPLAVPAPALPSQRNVITEFLDHTMHREFWRVATARDQLLRPGGGERRPVAGAGILRPLLQADLEARLHDGDLFRLLELSRPDRHLCAACRARRKLVEVILCDLHRQIELRRGAVACLRFARLLLRRLLGALGRFVFRRTDV